jgi:hypothetical protein
LLAHAATIAYQTLWKEKSGGDAKTISLDEVKSIEKKFANSCYAFKKDGEVYDQYKEILINKLEKN